MMRRLLLACLLLAPTMAHAEVEVDTTRLGHGVRAWYSENDTVPVVHITLTFEGAGSVSDSLGKQGRAALAANMLTEGAGPYDAVGYARAMEDKAIQISADASADRLTVQVHTLREHAEEAGRLLTLALTTPNFAEDDLGRVRAQTLSYLTRLKENPSYVASRRFEEVAFAGHPYASPVYGTLRSLTGMMPQDLRDYMATYVTRGNMLVTAAGDVDAGLLDDMLGPLVEALPDGDAGPVPVTRISMKDGGTSERVAMDVPQSTVVFAAPAIPRKDPRFYTAYLLNDILGGNGLTARLAEGVRQQQGLVYHISSALDERAGTSLITGTLATRSGQEADAIARVKAILSDIRTRGVTTAECEDARTHALGAFALQMDNSRNVASTLMSMRVYDLGTDYPEKRAEYFKDVRCADINTLASELLVPEKFLFVTAGAGQ